MSKSLSTILTVFKVVKIIAQVVFVFCIIGAAGCALSLAMLPFVGGMLPPELLLEEGLDLSATYQALWVGLIVCVGEIIFAFMAKRYFTNVLNVGTPFSFAGAKECFRLGIASLMITVITSVLTGLVIGLFQLLSPSAVSVDVEISLSLSTGLFFLFMSVIFKHGAELQRPETTQSEGFGPHINL